MYLKAFTDYLLYEKKYSPLTVSAYQRDIESLLQFVNKSNNSNQITIESINYSQIRSWIVVMVEDGVSNRSINRKISALNTCFKFLIKVDAIQTNPLSKHKALKTSKKVQIPFSLDEVDIAIANIDGQDKFESLRNKLIVETFYSTGIRRSELIHIKLKDFDAVNKTLKVLGKRNKERIIPLIPSVINTYKLYLEERNLVLNSSNNSYLFITSKGKKTYDTLIYRIINKYFKLISSKQKTSPHILRHSFATHLLNEGADLNAVKELLGHSSLSSTQVYTHNNIKELSKVYRSAHPRSKK
ncbi:integrase [Aurantibacter aestuarii]|uniref:Tyrosine recombinase XerC n=2 Tax=Aurantibacter aestuarii TaxID=1266046 RepID=A0A2T1N4V2_9FLAO|nr:integrase [Aurantibacter aestuarii]